MKKIFSKTKKCKWCKKKLDKNYYYYKMYNEILFRFCSYKCYEEAFKEVEAELDMGELLKLN